MVRQSTVPIGDRSLSRRGFTLVEIVIVVAIILLLSGMVIGTVVAVRDRGRMGTTTNRMQLILNALVNYGSTNGSSALSLQLNFPLGGVGSFATLRDINNVAIAGGVSPPPGIYYNYYSGGWKTVTLTPSNYLTGINDQESALFYRGIEGDIFEVMPSSLSAVTSASIYQTWWPEQWPITDWMEVVPGPNPPILRFPWGKPGMRMDGTLCDPSIPAGLLTGTYPQQFPEFTHSAGVFLHISEPMANSWVTMGNSPGGSSVAWQSNNSNQTDWVTLTGAQRSDGSNVPIAQVAGNLPIPFDMGFLSPLQTVSFLTAAGALSPITGPNDYRTNRSPNATWNDAWGNPLVVIYAMYQPERYYRTFDQQDRRDLLLRSALDDYQFNRAIYVAIASAGPTLPSTVPSTWTPTGDTVTFQAYWNQVRTVCNAVQWDETAFSNPPWQGVRISTVKVSGINYTCLLSAPTVIK